MSKSIRNGLPLVERPSCIRAVKPINLEIMQLELRENCYDKLLNHVPQDSPAFATLNNATVIGNERRLIICSQPDVDLFLETAKKNFPSQVREIESAYTDWMRADLR